MIKSAVGALTLGAVLAMGAIQASATTNTSLEVMTSQSIVYGKKTNESSMPSKRRLYLEFIKKEMC